MALYPTYKISLRDVNTMLMPEGLGAASLGAMSCLQDRKKFKIRTQVLCLSQKLKTSKQISSGSALIITTRMNVSIHVTSIVDKNLECSLLLLINPLWKTKLECCILSRFFLVVSLIIDPGHLITV